MTSRVIPAFGVVALFCLLAGCTTTGRPAAGPDAATLLVDKDGRLQSSNHVLIEDEDLPAFVKEIGDRPVSLVPSNYSPGGATFNTLLAAKRKLKSAGVSRVNIAGISAP